MVRKRYGSALAVALITGALALFGNAAGADAEQETFTSQCPGGTVEVWPTYTGPGKQSYFQGRGQVTVDFSFPPSDAVRTVVVTLVAISTGPDCTEVEVRTRTERSEGGGTPPTRPSRSFNLPAGSASFGSYDGFGDFFYSSANVLASRPAGDRILFTSSLGEALVGGPDQAVEVEAQGDRTCHNGRYYYGINATSGDTWISTCVTADLAASFSWDEANSSVSHPHPDDAAALSSGLPGWRYERWRNNRKISHTGCGIGRLSLGGEWREFACTMP